MRNSIRSDRSMHCLIKVTATIAVALLAASGAHAAEPDRKCYWDVNDVRPGMKGTGKTVMVGTRLDEFEAEVLGVMKDVSPGRDMILCRLKGCNLEHAGIIQGMSGSPIYIDGKLLGAVAFAWEFGKDPIAGVTPFCQMVEFVRAGDRHLAERERPVIHAARNAANPEDAWNRDRPLPPIVDASVNQPLVAGGGGLAGMRPIAVPLAARGFSPRAMSVLADRLSPLGLAPTSGGGALEAILKEHGDKKLEPGSPLSVALVTGDFDLSGIGTVTHVEGNRVYGFGHPMMSLGTCQFPMMNGFIHTVYPRASVSMKMGSPLRVVGVVDTDVSTAIAGTIGAKPDLLPVEVSVRTDGSPNSRTFRVQVVREPTLLASLMLTVLTNAIDTEGNLPEELTARVGVDVNLHEREPIKLRETLSGPRFSGPIGPPLLFSPVANVLNTLVRNGFEPLRIESVVCDVVIEAKRTTAEIESIRLASDRVEPGKELDVAVTLKPFKDKRETVNLRIPLPADLPEGPSELTICDMNQSWRRRLRNEPSLLEPRDLDAMLTTVRAMTAPRRTSFYAHVALPDRGLSVRGQPMPSLPGSIRAVLASSRQTPPLPVRADLVQSVDTRWVLEGIQTIRFHVVKNDGVSR